MVCSGGCHLQHLTEKCKLEKLMEFRLADDPIACEFGISFYTVIFTHFNYTQIENRFPCRNSTVIGKRNPVVINFWCPLT